MSLDPPANGWLILALILLGLGLVLWMFRRASGLVPPRYLGALAALRVGGVFGLAVLALQPYCSRLDPDTDAIEVAVLADTSGSMGLRDLPGGMSRHEAVAALLDLGDENSAAARLAERHPLRLHAFSRDIRVLAPGEPLPEPGGVTATGDALRSVLRDRGETDRTLAAVVLLTDGQETGGETRMIDAGRELRDAGVPVTTVGVGTPGHPRDLSVEFARTRLSVDARQPFNLEATVRNTLGREVAVDVELLHGASRIDTLPVRLAANDEKTLRFEVAPPPTGFHSYRVRIADTVEGTNPATDQDYATVEVEEPDRFRILYLSERLRPEFRFLRQVAAADDRLDLHGLIQTAEDIWTWSGPSGNEGGDDVDPIETFPDDGSFFLQFDAVVLDLATAPRLNESALDGLRALVANRAGGLLAVGPVAADAEALLGMLPVRATRPVSVRDDRHLSLEADPVFADGPRGVLFQRPGVFLAGGLSAHAGEPKRGAVPLATSREGDDIFAAVQAYGGGRVAWMGTADTWRWRLDSRRGYEQHRAFWSGKFLWLASSARPRVAVPLRGSRVSTEDTAALDVSVRGSDFRPEREARVTAAVQGPGGHRDEILLQPDSLEPGLFRGNIEPTRPGEYRVDYRIEFADGEVLTPEAFFAAAPGGAEFADTRLREAALRDLARLTSGRYLDWQDARRLNEIPLSEEIPLVESRQYLTRNWPFFLLLAALFASEWFLRRRTGLR